jgi:hypothetical protein
VLFRSTPTTVLALEFWSNRTASGVGNLQVTLVDAQGQEQVVVSDAAGRARAEIAGATATLTSVRLGDQEMLLVLNDDEVGGYGFTLYPGAEQGYRFITGETGVMLSDANVTPLPRDADAVVEGSATLVLYVTDDAGAGVPGVSITLDDDRDRRWSVQTDAAGQAQSDRLVGSFILVDEAQQNGQPLPLMLDEGMGELPEPVDGFLFAITQGEERSYDLTLQDGALRIHDRLWAWTERSQEPPPGAPDLASAEFTRENAEAVLRAFLEALHEGRYDEAVALFGGSYERLVVVDVAPDDHAGRMRAACERSGHHCLAVHSIVADEARSGAGVFAFEVSFVFEDGTLFAWQMPGFVTPSPGAETSQSAFPFSVVQEGGAMKVVGFPPYTP